MVVEITPYLYRDISEIRVTFINTWTKIKNNEKFKNLRKIS